MSHLLCLKPEQTEDNEGGIVKMQSKRFMGTLLLVLVILLMLFMAAGYAEEEKTDVSGQWKYILEDGNATITGYVEEPGGDLVIPGELDGYVVLRIEASAFGDCNNIASVTIPGSVMDMGDYAFQNCENLASVIMEEGVPYISFGAFSYCIGLQSVTIPDSVTMINSTAFVSCTSLDNVIIPDSVTEISDEAFFKCSSLTNITISGGITKISNRIFYGCSGLTDIIIPDGVTAIGEEAFYECNSLAKVTLPASVTEIGEDAFPYWDELTLIVKEGSYAEQYAKDNEVPYIFIGDSDADKAQTDTAAFKRGMELMDAEDYEGALALLNTAIAKNADVAEYHFNRGEALSSLDKFAESEQAYAKAVQLEPDNANYLCEYGYLMAWYNGKFQEGYEVLDQAVALEPSNGIYISVRGVLLNYLGRPLDALNEIERGIELEPDFVNAYFYAALVHYYSLYEYEEAARYCEEFIRRAGGEAWGGEAWRILGGAQYYLDNYAEALASFDKAIAVGYITAEDILIYDAAKRQAEAVPEPDADDPGDVAENDETDASGQWKYVLEGGGAVITGYVKNPVGDLAIPSKLDGYLVTGFGDDLFSDCYRLTSVTIPNGVTKISNGLFYNCFSITGVTIPDSVTAIGSSAFRGCYGLTGITIPASVAAIEEAAFSDCSGLTDVTIASGVIAIGNDTFTGCEKLTLTMIKGSDAEQYAKDNHIPYAFVAE
jgi:tetratricopeptide (TPR) repeat protein